MAENHGAHQTCEARVVSMTEDYCKSPGAPVGYMIWQTLDVSIRTAASVHGLGTPVLNMNSRIAAVNGNEAGVGGGTISGVNLGMCKPIKQYATKVRAEGQCVLTHTTVMEMNTAGPDGPGNTVGRIVYVTTSSNVYNSRRSLQAAHGADWKLGAKIGDAKVSLPDGTSSTVPIYRGTWCGSGAGPNAQYIGGGRNSVIVVGDHIPAGSVTEKAKIAHETQHFEDDFRTDHTLNGKLHDESGNVLTRKEAEERAYNAGMNAMTNEYNVLGCTFLGSFSGACNEVTSNYSEQKFKAVLNEIAN